MKRFKVIVSQDTKRQILEHVLYVAQDSIDNALAWEVRLDAAIESIGDSPGHAIDEDATFRAGEAVRKVVFEKTYLIFYRINETIGAIEVVNFRHGARLPKRGEP